MQTKKIQHSKNGNKLADWPIRTLILSMGMPMVLSMVLQAVYNIVDTIFVSHMKNGETAVLALTDSYSIQLLIVAIGVGTGIGINALLAKTLGERDGKKAAQIAGNGIFLGICIFLVFFLFGIFGVRGFIAMQAKSNALRQEMGTTYLTICCLGSFGNIGYTVYERFLQSTGRTNLSTIAQISGAVLNMILVIVFHMDVAGVGIATVISQMISCILVIRCLCNSQTSYQLYFSKLRINKDYLKQIFQVGIPAGIQSTVINFSNALLQSSVNSFGSIAMAGYTAANNIFGFLYVAVNSVTQACMSFTSQNYGVRKFKRMDKVLIDCIIISMVTALTLG